MDRFSREEAGWPASLAWARALLPDYFTDEPCRLHIELLAALEDPTRRLVACVAPRGHAKSTCAAFAYPLWCICERRRRNIVIITHESSLARQFVRDIRHELESNHALRARYGDLCDGSDRPPRAARAGRRWSDAFFVTTTGVTVQAKGTGSGLRGTRSGPHRPDLIICDDLEEDRHVRSAPQRRALERWLLRVVIPALAPGGQIVVLGSLLHPDSLLANLRDRQRFRGWHYLVYRAIEAVPCPGGDYRRVALWPARWPLTRLDEERQRIGAVAFDQEYQAAPRDPTQRAFRPEWLRPYDRAEIVPERLVRLMAVDPATGEARGDYFAVWVGGVDRASGVIYTLELALDRIPILEQVQRVMSAFRHWRPVRIGIETTGNQKPLYDSLGDESRRTGLYLPLVAIRNTLNKAARIEGTVPLYAQGRFRLPPLPADIEQQFLDFPHGRHDDAPDVCAMGVELARGLTTVGGSPGLVVGEGMKEWRHW